MVEGSLLVTTTGAPAAFADVDPSARAVADGVIAVDVAPGDLAATVARLAADPSVVAVEPNRVRQFHAVPDDPAYGQQWAHQLTGIEEAWDVTTGSGDVLIAIADSGVVADHPELDRVVEQVDASSGQIEPGASDNDPCQVGHGTWVAGVLGATGQNARGVAGVDWGADILDINTADPEISCAGRRTSAPSPRSRTPPSAAPTWST
ncbi:S8 family serine peptidase [Euzebya sp.]|uniref:S8 family serine peptidase n=1 Tax=Euzebya sp. TaxID=1971409 RepID=UPI003515FFA6